jgi:hypothetical protein
MTWRGAGEVVWVALLVLAGWLFGVQVGRSTTYAEMLPHVATVDTTYIFPEPMHVGSTLGLHCYIERRDPSTTAED